MNVKIQKNMFINALNTWSGLLVHKLLHQCSMVWRHSACGTAEVLRCKAQVALISAFSSSVLLDLVFHISPSPSTVPH